MDLESRPELIESRHKIRESVDLGLSLLNRESYVEFAELVFATWSQKKKFGNVTNKVIEDLLEFSMKNGAIGGKLLGAGGGGFLLLFAVEGQTQKLVEALKSRKMKLIQPNLDTSGTKIVYNDEQ
jgi:D-glycero-alpha-D-manno-heptose-7-phosphate kinase